MANLPWALPRLWLVPIDESQRAFDVPSGMRAAVEELDASMGGTKTLKGLLPAYAEGTQFVGVETPDVEIIETQDYWAIPVILASGDLAPDFYRVIIACSETPLAVATELDAVLGADFQRGEVMGLEEQASHDVGRSVWAAWTRPGCVLALRDPEPVGHRPLGPESVTNILSLDVLRDRTLFQLQDQFGPLLKIGQTVFSLLSANLSFPMILTDEHKYEKIAATHVGGRRV